MKIFDEIKKNRKVNTNKAFKLLYLQIALIILAILTLILIVFVDNGSRFIFYFSLLCILIIILGASLVLSLVGKYMISVWLTMLCVLIGPWFSILMDKKVLNGDLLPIIYITLTIYIYAFFLSVKITIIISALQIITLRIFIQSNPLLLKENWPSLISFLIFSSVIAIVYNFISRNQIKFIEEQKAKLEDDEEQMRILSTSDPLTGLFNRRYMNEFLKRQIQSIIKKNKHIGIIIGDVDDFKIINDTYGHIVGDSVLVEIGKLIISNIREKDIACRFGGDEFIIILPECSLENSYKRAEGVKEAINNFIFKNDKNELFSVNMSFGVASFPENGTIIDNVIIAADKALYLAKKSGKNNVV